MNSNQVLNIRHNLLQGQYVGIAPADIQQVGVMGRLVYVAHTFLGNDGAPAM